MKERESSDKNPNWFVVWFHWLYFQEKCKRWLTILVTILVSICALGGMFDTVAFFHSRQESIAAFGLVSGNNLPFTLLQQQPPHPVNIPSQANHFLLLK